MDIFHFQTTLRERVIELVVLVKCFTLRRYGELFRGELTFVDVFMLKLSRLLDIVTFF